MRLAVAVGAAVGSNSNVGGLHSALSSQQILQSSDVKVSWKNITEDCASVSLDQEVQQQNPEKKGRKSSSIPLEKNQSFEKSSTNQLGRQVSSSANDQRLIDLRRKLTHNRDEVKKQQRIKRNNPLTLSKIFKKLKSCITRKQSIGEADKTMDEKPSLKSKLQKVGQAINKEKMTVDREADELHSAIKGISEEKLQQKAMRHLLDGLLYRGVRHDLDQNTPGQKYILLVYRIQNSSIWNDFLLFLGWVYICMSFFEPTNRNDDPLPEDVFSMLLVLEVFILVLQTLDLGMEVMQRFRQRKSENVFQILLQRKKNLFRCIFFLLNASDLIYYASSYPENTFRFARIVRPLQIIIFSKPLRRNFQGIISSARNLLMILFFYLLIICFWAYIGVNMLSDLYEDPEVDTYAVDFRDFLKASNALYVLSSLDLYPDILFPAVQSSLLYLMYFLPYLKDRIKRRKALWACFQCIVKDRKKSYIEREDFVNFFRFVYSNCEDEDTANDIAEVLWMELDSNSNNKLSIEEFFGVLDVTEQRFEFRLQRIKPLPWWRRFRNHVDSQYNLANILNGSTFQNISFAVTLGSCVTTIIGLLSDDDSQTVDVTNIIDKMFFAFFVLEILLKLVADGVYGFFQESWNIFDLVLVLFQVFFDYVFIAIAGSSNVKSVSATRVLKIAKLQKIFRMFRALRTVKILSFIFQGLDFIHKVYEMLYKIVICIPIVLRLSVICVIVLYIYAVVGVELFATNLYESIYAQTYGQNLCAPGTNSDDFTECEYANFDSFGTALIVLLQVCVGSGWGYILFEYAKKFDAFDVSLIYFNTFHFITVFVLSLIGGLVWEVFDVVERIMRDQQAYEAQQEIQSEWEEQQQMLEGSFQSGLGMQSSSKDSQAKKKGGIARPSLLNAIAKFKGPIFEMQKDGVNITEEDEEPEKRQRVNTIIPEETAQQEGISSSDSDDEEDSDGDNENNGSSGENSRGSHDMKLKDGEEVNANQSVRQNISDLEHYKQGQVFLENIPTEQVLVQVNYNNKDNNAGTERPETQETVDKTMMMMASKKTSILKPTFVFSRASEDVEVEKLKVEEERKEQDVKIKLALSSFEIKKQPKKKKLALIDPYPVEEDECIEWSCFEDDKVVSQRERGQLILYQEKFQMTTEDGLFRGKNVQVKQSSLGESSKKSVNAKILSQINEEDDLVPEEQIMRKNEESGTAKEGKDGGAVFVRTFFSKKFENNRMNFSQKKENNDIKKEVEQEKKIDVGTEKSTGNEKGAKEVVEEEAECQDEVSSEIRCKSPRQSKQHHHMRDFSSSNGFFVYNHMSSSQLSGSYQMNIAEEGQFVSHRQSLLVSGRKADHDYFAQGSGVSSARVFLVSPYSKDRTDRNSLQANDDADHSSMSKSPVSGKIPEVQNGVGSKWNDQQAMLVEQENQFDAPFETKFKASGGNAFLDYQSSLLGSMMLPQAIEDDDMILLSRGRQQSNQKEDIAIKIRVVDNDDDQVEEELVEAKKKELNSNKDSVNNSGQFEGFLKSPPYEQLGVYADGIEMIGKDNWGSQLEITQLAKKKQEGQQLDGSFLIEVNEIQKQIVQQTDVDGNNKVEGAGAEKEECKSLGLIEKAETKKKQKKQSKRHVLAEKNKAELYRYYREGLLDVELQNGSLSSQPVKNSFAQMALSKAKTIEYKTTQRELIQDAPGNKLLKQQVQNMNENLRQNVPFQMMIDLSNMNYIINKAILKNLNQEKVEKVEIRHFRSMYGSHFEDMLDNEIFPMWQVQARVLFHFDNTLKYDHITVESFVQLFTSLELQMSSLLMNKFSHLKFIFQIGGTDEWFTINYLQDSYYCQSIRNTDGPWEYFDELFHDYDNDRLIKHRNVFSYAEKNKFISQKLKRYFNVSQAISNNPYFRKLQINQKRSDIIYIPFINEAVERSQKKTFDAIQLAVKTPEYMFEEDLEQSEIPFISKALIVVHLTDNPIVKDRDRRMRSGNTVSIEHAIIEEDVLEKEQINSTLNYPYSVEFLKDIRNHVEMNKQKLFAKIAQFYYHRYCFEKNFTKIRQMPFS